MATLKEGVATAISTAVCAGARGADWVAGLLANTPLPLGGLQEQTDKFRAFACNDNPVADPLPIADPQTTGFGDPNVVFKIEGTDFQYNPKNMYLRGVISWTKTGSSNYEDTVLAYGNKPASNVSEAVGAGCTVMFGSGSITPLLADPPRLWNCNEIGQLRRINNLYAIEACGQSAGEPAPPPPIEEHEEDVDVEYDDPAGNPVTLPNIPVKFFKPCINLDGIRIPFEVDLGFAKLCGKVGLQPDLKTILEPAIDFDQCPSEKQDVGYSQEQIEDFFEFLPAIGDPINFPDERYRGESTTNWDLENKPIQGVFIRAIKNGDLSKTIVLKPENNSSPNLILPRIGTIFFEYLIEKEDGYETGFSDAIPIKNVGQFIPCPWQFGAVKVHYIRENGWDMSLFPVARKSCCDACSGNDPNKGLDNLDRCRID